MIWLIVVSKICAVGVLALAAETLKRCGVRPHYVYAAWLATLVALLAPPVFTIPLLQQSSLATTQIDEGFDGPIRNQSIRNQSIRNQPLRN